MRLTLTRGLVQYITVVLTFWDCEDSSIAQRAFGGSEDEVMRALLMPFLIETQNKEDVTERGIYIYCLAAALQPRASHLKFIKWLQLLHPLSLVFC